MYRTDLKSKSRILDDLPSDVYVSRRAQSLILAGFNRESVIAQERRNPRFGSMIMEGKSLAEMQKVYRSTSISREEKQRLLGYDLKPLGLLDTETYPFSRRSYDTVLRPTMRNEKFIFTSIDDTYYHCFVDPEYVKKQRKGARHMNEFSDLDKWPMEQDLKFKVIKYFDPPEKNYDCVIVKKSVI